MRVLITGITGFVGSGLVHYFNSFEGVEIVGHSRDKELASEKFKSFDLKLIPDCTAKAFDEFGIDSIIHLAGIAHDLSNKYLPQDYYKVNLEGTKAVFQEFVKSNAKQFIFLSSIKATVDISKSPVDEATMPRPSSDYGKSKQLAEDFILQQALPSGKSAYILRPCMIHGKGNKGNLNVLFKFSKLGLPYLFGAYSNQRSFLSADNLNFIVYKFLQNNYPSGIYHLADDQSFSTNELMRLISSSLNRKPRIWKIPVSLLDRIFKLSSFFGLPFEKLKNKLTEDLVVSTDKLRSVLKSPLPVSGREGLLKTLKSFE